MSHREDISLVPCGEDVLAVAARRVLDSAGLSLPDLSHAVILLPDLQHAARLRRLLLEQAQARGHGGLLGPVITRPETWLEERIPASRPVASRPVRELMLLDALRDNPSLFGGADPWRLGDSLITLFEELTQHRVRLADRLDLFIQQIGQAYGTEEEAPEALGLEAGIVHRLWRAWHEQLDARGVMDPVTAHLERLSASLDDGDDRTRLFLVGHTRFTSAEIDWLHALLNTGRAELILHGGASPALPDRPIRDILERLDHEPFHQPEPDAIAQCLDSAFTPGDDPIALRASRFQARFPVSPLTTRISIYPATSAEQEAQAVELQVRRWLLEDRQTIGIVTEDRKLARRVRALLERAGIALQDSGGWALSTTSAAAALERWLETVEEDFAHQPLLDVLKSPFICADPDRDRHLATVFRLERDIILHENIARGLDRYRHHLELRARRLPDWSESATRELGTLLDRLDEAASPLREAIAAPPLPATVILERLQTSLDRLGMWQAFQTDPAGQRIVQEWEQLHRAASQETLSLDWLEFRTWLGRTLERHDFRPYTADSPVQLLSLQGSSLARFDALVIAACDREHLPGQPEPSPFFNDGVRGELGLSTWQERFAERLHHFRRLLECAPRVMLSYRCENNGEAVLPSPWLEVLQVFHQLAYGPEQDLYDTELGALLPLTGTRVQPGDRRGLPLPGSNPRPSLPSALRRESLSASSHQRLLDCPYRWFIADCLGLKAVETVSEALEKSDYGERIHRCLEAFHGGCEHLPGPFTKRLSATNRGEAIDLLRHISRTVFARDLEDNFEHRAWLRRWEEMIPAYIDWQASHEEEWHVQSVEQRHTVILSPRLGLAGRLDRIDTHGDSLGIIDYKTGGVPDQDEVDQGEAVQLPSYALLAGESVRAVTYLKVDGEIDGRIRLEGEKLCNLAEAVARRLETVIGAIDDGAALPAWGDARTCSYCEMDGICRRQAWSGT